MIMVMIKYSDQHLTSLFSIHKKYLLPVPLLDTYYSSLDVIISVMRLQTLGEARIGNTKFAELV